jgi:hypothetical protein
MWVTWNRLDKKTPAAEQPGMVPRGGLLIPQPGILNIAYLERKVKHFYRGNIVQIITGLSTETIEQM